MAVNSGVYTGESGVVKFVGADSTVAAVASIRSFTVDREVQTIETSVMGETNRTYTPGLGQFSGSLDVYLRDDDPGQSNFLSYMDNPAAVAEIELYPSGTTTGVKLSGSIIPTGHSLTSNFDSAVEGSIQFQGSGALTRLAL
jgi:predicted secreted protein|tara:strand:- start:23 stop:448 length:426 start_codon:yes stop_codon:yes gene_type:complete